MGSETGSALAVSHLSLKRFSQKFHCGSMGEGADDSSDGYQTAFSHPHAAGMLRRET